MMRENNVNPPRPNVHTYQYRRMSGYRPVRGDFEAEYNNSFDMKWISDIDYYEAPPVVAVGNEIEISNRLFKQGRKYWIRREFKNSSYPLV